MTFKIVEKAPFWRLCFAKNVPLNCPLACASGQRTASPKAAVHILRFPGSLHLPTWGSRRTFWAPGMCPSKPGTLMATRMAVFPEHLLSPCTAPRERCLQSHERVWHLHQLHRSLHDNENGKLKQPRKPNHQDVALLDSQTNIGDLQNMIQDSERAEPPPWKTLPYLSPKIFITSDTSAPISIYWLCFSVNYLERGPVL